MIKVSVIVPVYNGEQYLKKCLDSLCNQTLDNIEIIVINDASIDNTASILEDYRKNNSNIRIITNKKNKGIGYNRNKGIKEAKGTFISFVDCDDYLDKSMLEKMYNKAVKDNSELVICNYYMMQENGTEIKNDINIVDENTKTLKDNSNLLLDINLSPWNKLYKKELIEDISFVEKMKYEDAPFVIKALNRANKISFVDEKLYYYIIHSKSETTVVDKRVFDIFKVLDLILDELKDNNSEYKEAFVIRTLFRYTLQQRNQKDKEVANKFIDDAFIYLNSNFPNWKKNSIYKRRSFFKRMIEKNKKLTKIAIKL